MQQTHFKKLWVSSIVLTLMLSGSSLYAPKSAFAENSLLLQQQTESLLQQQQGEQRKHKSSLPIVNEAAAILKIDKDTLKAALQSGKSIVDIAKEKGISETDLTSKLLAVRNAKIDEAVKTGKLDEQKAQQIKAKMAEHLKFMLNEKGILSKHEHYKKEIRHGMYPNLDKLAQGLGISKDQLRTELKAGKSLLEIAESKGMTKEQLVNNIKEQMTPHIEHMVKHKKGE